MTSLTEQFSTLQLELHQHHLNTPLTVLCPSFLSDEWTFFDSYHLMKSPLFQNWDILTLSDFPLFFFSDVLIVFEEYDKKSLMNIEITNWKKKQL